MTGIYGSSAVVTSLIENYIDQGIEFGDLTDQQLNELTAEWIIADAPGNPHAGRDFYCDAFTNNLDLSHPFLERMAGRENPNYDITEIEHSGIREECKDCVKEFWGDVANKVNREDAA